MTGREPGELDVPSEVRQYEPGYVLTGFVDGCARVRHTRTGRVYVDGTVREEDVVNGLWHFTPEIVDDRELSRGVRALAFTAVALTVATAAAYAGYDLVRAESHVDPTATLIDWSEFPDISAMLADPISDTPFIGDVLPIIP